MLCIVHILHELSAEAGRPRTFGREVAKTDHMFKQFSGLWRSLDALGLFGGDLLAFLGSRRNKSTGKVHNGK